MNIPSIRFLNKELDSKVAWLDDLEKEISSQMRSYKERQSTLEKQIRRLRDQLRQAKARDRSLTKKLAKAGESSATRLALAKGLLHNAGIAYFCDKRAGYYSLKPHSGILPTSTLGKQLTKLADRVTSRVATSYGTHVFGGVPLSKTPRLTFTVRRYIFQVGTPLVK